MNKPTAYRRAIEIAAKAMGRPDVCGDMVGDLDGGIVKFYAWWHYLRFTHTIERLSLQNKVPHSLLRDSAFRLIYNSVPGLTSGVHLSYQLLWVGPRSEWIWYTK
jgi:hypothetical protein